MRTFIRFALGAVVALCIAYLLGAAIDTVFTPAGRAVDAVTHDNPNDGHAAALIRDGAALIREPARAALTAILGTGSPVTLGDVVLTGGVAHLVRRAIRPAGRRGDRVLTTIGLVENADAICNGEDACDGLANVQESRAQKIADVKATLRALDSEWLAYEMDLEAFFLTKPLLRDPEVPQTAAYMSALDELRTHAESLMESSTPNDVALAERAAGAAKTAWAEANAHAAAVGISDCSPGERAALRRVRGLVAQLSDPATPRPMWAGLTDAISREMAKLTVHPMTWSHLPRMPALQSRVPAALTAPSVT